MAKREKRELYGKKKKKRIIWQKEKEKRKIEIIKMDLCKEKKFINLNGRVHINQKNNKVVSLADKDNDVWVVERKISEGSSGMVYLYLSSNPAKVDLVIKYFCVNEEYAELDMELESEVVELFNKHRCSNFIQAGVKQLKDKEKIIIMERVEGDMTEFDFSVFPQPLKIYSGLIDFLASGSRCAYKKDKLYMDMKSENIGFKICNTGVKFTFLDLGSFFNVNEDDIVTTYYINFEKFNNFFFSNRVMFVYSLVITLLTIRLDIKGHNFSEKFSYYVLEQIGNEKRYSAKKGLLSVSNYDRIMKRFKEYIPQQEKFIDYLFSSLKKLTEREPNVDDFLIGLQNSNRY